MSGLLDGAPVIFLAVMLVISLAFVAMPTFIVWSFVVAARRRRAWTRTEAVVTATRIETSGSGDNRTTRVRGRYTYRGADGVERTGQGIVGGAWMSERDGQRHLAILVHPTEPERSVPDVAPPHPVVMTFACLFLSVFFLIGAALFLGSAGALVALAT